MSHLEVNGDFYKGNYNEQEFYIEKPKDQTGEPEPATDIPGLEIFISVSKGGEPLDEGVVKPAQMRPGNPGRWYAPFSGDDFDDVLFPDAEPTLFDKKRIWVRLRDPNGIVDRSFPRMAYLIA